MTTKTDTAINERYRKAAEEFARRLCGQAGAAVHSVVLYGSVARREAGSESDIDLLVLTEGDRPDLDDLVSVGDAIDYENNYDTYLMATPMTAEQLNSLWERGSPFAEDVFKEGQILHDDGTFEGVRTRSLGTGGRNAA